MNATDSIDRTDLAEGRLSGESWHGHGASPFGALGGDIDN